jgi:valyl-tRNA synthetase
MAAQGRDIKLSEERIAGYRNFSTKIWNGCKFLEFNDCISYIDKDIKKIDLEVNKWIVKLYNDLNNRVKTAIKEYKFNDAADALYQFIWKDYCDWYIEFIKPILNNTDNLKDFEETKHVSINIMKNVLLMLHPIMPYVTEEILENLFKSSKFAISSTWPEPIFNKLSLNNSIDLVIKIISSIRSLRVEKNIPPNSKIDVIFKNVNKDKKDIIESNINLITNLAKLNGLTFVSEDITQTDNFIISTVDEIVLMIPLQGLIDTESEKNRLNKELSNINNEIDQISKRLNNQMFIDKAPSKVVQEVKNKQEIFYQRKSEIEKALNNL